MKIGFKSFYKFMFQKAKYLDKLYTVSKLSSFYESNLNGSANKHISKNSFILFLLTVIIVLTNIHIYDGRYTSNSHFRKRHFHRDKIVLAGKFSFDSIDLNLSVVVNFSHFYLHLQNHSRLISKLGTKHNWLQGNRATPFLKVK